MIRLTRFDGTPMFLNADWIQSVEETPDTVITLTTGLKFVVKEAVHEVVSAFLNYKREINMPQLDTLAKRSKAS